MIYPGYIIAPAEVQCHGQCEDFGSCFAISGTPLCLLQFLRLGGSPGRFKEVPPNEKLQEEREIARVHDNTPFEVLAIDVARKILLNVVDIETTYNHANNHLEYRHGCEQS
jgi:hypothetical protein